MPPHGQMAFFAQFLKTFGLYQPWVEACPLSYESPNAPAKANVLGTTALSALAGHWRYAHARAIRCDQVSPTLLGMGKVAARTRSGEPSCLPSGKVEAWQAEFLRRTYERLLYEPYVIDMDTTVKPRYGKHQGAKIGYNPAKSGRPSHEFHTYFITSLRLVLDVEVRAGDETAAKHTQLGFWGFLDKLPQATWPSLVRGDIAFGNESMMAACEARELGYLFKLRLTSNVKSLVKMVSATAAPGWTPDRARRPRRGHSSSSAGLASAASSSFAAS